MIISASRRTDIPAFYAQWFENRIHEGFALVPNPFNPNQVSRISLVPEDVEAIVFWTRYPQPIIDFLPTLAKEYRFYFLFTLLDYPRFLDPKMPPMQKRIDIFRRIADLIGPEKVIWRYDPIVFTNRTDLRFHREAYQRIASSLRGFTGRSVISIVDLYRKLKSRMADLGQKGISVDTDRPSGLKTLLTFMIDTAEENGMELVSCAEDLLDFGIRPGKCIDDQWLSRVFGGKWANKKDPHQRKECNCVVSRDIGMYDSCRFQCRYCYATRNFETAKRNFKNHDRQSPFLFERP